MSPSDIFTIGRTLAVLAMEFRGYQSHVRRRRCRRSTTPRCSSATTRSTACWPRPPRRTPTTASSPPTRCATNCSACCARSSPSTAGVAAAAHSNPSSLFGAPTGDRRGPRVDGPAGAPDRPGRSVGDLARRCVARRRRPAPRGARAGAAADRRGAAREGPGRDRRRRRSPSRTRSSTTSSPTTRGSGARSGCPGLAALAPVGLRSGRDRVQHRARPGAGRAGAQARAGAGLRARPEPSDLAEQLYAVCAATDANYVAPAAFGLARTREQRGDAAGSLAGPRPGRADQRRVRRGPSPARRPARRAPRPASTTSRRPPPASRTSRSIARDRLTHPGAHPHRGDHRGRRARRRSPDARSAACAATEPDLRAAAEQAYRDLATLTSDRAERIRLVDDANAVRPRTLV